MQVQRSLVGEWAIIWVAVKELKLSYHNGLKMFRCPSVTAS